MKHDDMKHKEISGRIDVFEHSEGGICIRIMDGHTYTITLTASEAVILAEWIMIDYLQIEQGEQRTPAFVKGMPF